jgi:DNA-directed RNA polymerase subunit RPC12/RpoP
MKLSGKHIEHMPETKDYKCRNCSGEFNLIADAES